MCKHIDPRLVAEQFEKQNRAFKIYEHYAPDLKQSPVTAKFYSKYDAIDYSKADPEIVKKIEFLKVLTPKKKYPAPVQESHRYGWFTKPLTDKDWKDERYHHPKQEHDNVKAMLRIKTDKSLRDTAFSGVPWK